MIAAQTKKYFHSFFFWRREPLVCSRRGIVTPWPLKPGWPTMPLDGFDQVDCFALEKNIKKIVIQETQLLK